MIFKWLAALAALIALTACGGGSGSSDNGGNGNRSGIASNTFLMSDILFSARGGSDERGTMDCAPDRSSCSATWRGRTFSTAEADLENPGDKTAWTSLGSWEYMKFGVVYGQSEEGVRGKVAIVGGIWHHHSLSPSGAATWRGDMVALDAKNELVDGNAEISIPDLRDPAVDIVLMPSARATMTWTRIPVTGGGFQRRQASDNYIEGRFYGPFAQEVGGIFERNQMIGAFGGKR